MKQIVIKTDDPARGVRIETFDSREAAERYMDEIGLVATPPPVEEPKEPAKTPEKPATKPAKKSKAKKH